MKKRRVQSETDKVVMEQGSDIESNGLPQGCQQLSGRKIEGGPSKDGNKKKGSNSGVLGAALSK